MSLFKSLFARKANTHPTTEPKNEPKNASVPEKPAYVDGFDFETRENNWVRAIDFVDLTLQNLRNYCPQFSHKDRTDYIFKLTSEIPTCVVNSERDSYISKGDLIAPEHVYFKLSDALELSMKAGEWIGAMRVVARLRSYDYDLIKARNDKQMASNDHIHDHIKPSTLLALHALLKDGKTRTTKELRKSRNYTLYKKDSPTPPPFHSSTDGEFTTFRFALRRGKNVRVRRLKITTPKPPSFKKRKP